MNSQAELERRYQQAAETPLDRRRTPREQFGEFESWLLRLGSYELLLNPIDGTWHEYDRRSDSSRPLGYLAGEASFGLEGDRLVIRPLSGLEPGPEAGSARLQVIIGAARGTDGPLGSETSIGSGPDNDIVLAAVDADPHHAVIRSRPEGYVIVDLASRGGTLVNGERVSAPVALRSGDVITIGSTQLAFRN